MHTTDFCLFFCWLRKSNYRESTIREKGNKKNRKTPIGHPAQVLLDSIREFESWTQLEGSTNYPTA